MNITQENDELVIRIPIPEDPTTLPLSITGKTYVVATTGGYKKVLDTDMVMMLNLIIPNNEYVLHEKKPRGRPRKEVPVVPQVPSLKDILNRGTK